MHQVLELARRIEAHDGDPDPLIRAFLDAHTFPLTSEETAVFFFYDGQPAQSVRLVHWVFGLESAQAFRQLGDSNAWYLPLELPKRARVEYKFAVERGGSTYYMRDPHNDRRAFDPFGSNSVCPMPGYTVPVWVRQDPSARAGRMDHFEVETKVYGGKRPIHVWLPAEFAPYKQYPLLIVHDGDDYRKYAAMRTVLDNLVHRNEVAPLIVAFTSGVDRNREYGADRRQADFLVQELLPAIGARYPLMEGPDTRGLCGASFGAVTSLFTAWAYPGVFGKLFLQSGSFVFTDVGGHGRSELFDPVVRFVNEMREDPGRIDAKIFMTCGHFESLIHYNRALVPLLRASGLEVAFEESADGHNWVAWRDRLRDGLSWLFPGAHWMTYP